MRIGIDVRYLSHGLIGGVHTYVANFVPTLVNLACEHEIYLYADTKRPFELKSLPEHVTVRYLPWRNQLSSVWHDLFMRNQMSVDRLDVVHFPANYGFAPAGARTVITLHDVINVLPLSEIIRGHPKKPKVMAMMTYLHWCTEAAIPRADRVLTVSEFARQEIAARAGIDLRKIGAVHHGPTPGLRRIDDQSVLDEVRRRHGLTCSFVLADALKNPAVLVRAWRRLPTRLQLNRRIVFFSRSSNPLPIVHEAVAAGEAQLLVRPSREDLMALYSMAEAFVFPSWIEGFGIPLLEAMTCGAPIIASDRGSIPEVVGDAGLLADAEDEATLARHLELILTSPVQASDLRARGFARAAQFSWPKAAQSILDSYLQVVSCRE